ncbi:hypothetical protein H8D59_01165 [bacterium]|nr:hypothetical protein [bacterium]MBL7052119.1 hypothetical protein [Candidatus Neomarinimicrobiota bacterium]
MNKKLILIISMVFLFSQNSTDSYGMGYHLNHETGEMEMIVIVLGAVENSGQYSIPVQSDIISLLAIVGGITKEANLESVRVIRRNSGDENTILMVDVEQFLKRGNGEIIRMEPGDIVIVERKKGIPWNTVLPIISMALQIVNLTMFLSTR